MKQNYAFIVGSLLLLGGGGIALASQSMSNTGAPPTPAASASEVGTRSSEGAAPEDVVWNNPDIFLPGISYGSSIDLTFTPDGSESDINKDITWTVDPEDIAEIIKEDEGRYAVISRKFGTAKITGIAANKQELSGTVTVNGIKIEELWGTQFFVDDTKKLSLITYPEELGENVVWSSSAPDVVSVSDDGTITCLSPGRADITARSTGNDRTYDSQTTVNVYPQPGEVAFVNKEEWLQLGSSNTLGMSVMTYPDESIQGTWNIADTQIVKFESDAPQGIYCQLLPVNVGTTDVTFTPNNGGSSITCKVNVYKEIESITASRREYTLMEGDTCKIELSVLPENSNNPILYTSHNEDVATVDSNGVITAVETGHASIECHPTRGWNSEWIYVEVQAYPDSIMVSNANDFNIPMGETRPINVEFTPNENINRTVEWTVDNKEIAEIVKSENEYDDRSFVKGLAIGKTIVRGKTPNGVTTEFEVNVYGLYDWDENSFELNASDKSLNVGQTFQIKIEGKDKGQTFTYSSEDESIATVDSLGLVTAVTKGETYIIVRPMPQGWPNKNLRVKVCEAPENVELSRTEYLLTSSYNHRLDITFTPDNDDVNREISWTYNPEGVVEMEYSSWDRSYFIKPLNLGQTTVTGIASNGQELQFTARYEGVKIDNKQEYRDVTVGDEFDLAVSTSAPEMSENIQWRSDNPEIISVENGHVTCLQPGTSYIYAVVEYEGQRYEDQMYIISHPEEGQIGFNRPSLLLPVGERAWPEVILPIGDDDYDGKWSVAEEGIIKLYNEESRQCYIDGIAEGTTTLTYTMPDERSASMAVTVFTRIEDFSLNSREETLAQGKTFQIEVTNVYPEVENPRMIYTSENEEIATVDSTGLVTAIGFGDVSISVKPQYQDWPTQWLTVHVKEVPDSVEMQNSRITLDGINYVDYLRIKFTPDNENIDKSIKWSYSEEGIITIEKDYWDNEYYAYGRDFGTVTFTGEASNGQILEGTATVNGIAIVGDDRYLHTGESLQFGVKASSAEILNSARWTSDNSEIAEVDENGNVTALQPGSTRIWVTGNSETRTYRNDREVIVYPEEGSIALSCPSIESLPGNWYSIIVVLPEGEYIYDGVWTISDENVIEQTYQTYDRFSFQTIAAGTTTITYTMADGRSASCVVTVKGDENDKVEYITLDSYEEYGKIGGEFQMSVTAYPENFGKTIYYYSENPEVATVDSEGLVRYVGYGSTKISAYIDNSEGNGEYVWAQMNVMVYEEPTAATIEEGEEITINTPQELTPISIEFEAPEGVEPEDVCTDIVWKYSEYGIIDIVKSDPTSRARVRALGTRADEANAKTAEFAIKARDFGTVEYWGYSPYDTEKVNPLVSGIITVRGIIIDSDALDCFLDETAIVSVRTSDSDVASNLTVNTDDKNIARIESNDDGTYTIRGWNVGYTTINAVSVVDGITYSAYTPVNVMLNPDLVDRVASISLDRRDLFLYIFDTAQLAATVRNCYDSDLTSASISWTSSDPAVATVSPDGSITPEGYGRTVITATAIDTYGNSMSATCEVYVVKFSAGGGNSGGGSGDEPDDPSGVDSLFGEEGTCDIYNVNGEVLKQNATKADFEALDKGIYIVRKDNKAVKVVK